jgi:hypothetical protein
MRTSSGAIQVSTKSSDTLISVLLGDTEKKRRPYVYGGKNAKNYLEWKKQ